MIYVEMLGLLGNQMFSYSFAKSLQLEFEYRDKIAFEFKNSLHRDDGNQLGQFMCDDIVGEDRKLSIIQRGMLFLYFRLRKKRGLDKEFSVKLQEYEKKWAGVLSYFGIYCYSFGYYPFKHKTLFKNKLVLGFYESPAFFLKHDKDIRKSFELRTRGKDCEELIESIESDKVTIGVGIRKIFYNDSLRSTCSIGYIKRGIEYIVGECQKKGQSPVVYIYPDSQDIKWIEEELKYLNVKLHFVTQERYNLSSAEKMICMSKCTHFVINNSTFEWWAQHLGNSDDKIVVAPDKWRNEPEILWHDIYEKNWIIFNGKELNGD